MKEYLSKLIRIHKGEKAILVICFLLHFCAFSYADDFIPINKTIEGVNYNPCFKIVKVNDSLYNCVLIIYDEKQFLANKGNKLVFILDDKDSVVLERDHYKTIITSLPTVSRKSKTICASANSYNLPGIDPLLYQNITKILIQKNDGSYEEHEIQKDYQPTLSYEIKSAVEKLNKSTESGLKQDRPTGLGTLKYLLLFLLIGIALYVIYNRIKAKAGNANITPVSDGQTDKAASLSIISQGQYNAIRNYSMVLRNLFGKISKDKNVFDAVNEKSASVGGDVMPDYNYFCRVIKCIFFQDLKRCYEGMGHTFAFSSMSKTGQCLILVSTVMNEESAFARYDSFKKGMAGELNIEFESARSNFAKFRDSSVNISVEGSNEFGLSALLRSCEGNKNDLEQYRIYLYRLVSQIVKIDGKVTPEEKDWLERMLAINEQQPEDAERDTIASLPEDDLNGLIGLKTVKEEVKALSNFITVRQKRKEMGLSLPEVSYHYVFTGNPGTGKTTVARILAGIYRDKGILKKGHLVETDRSGLVAEYVGQTAVKTNRIIDKALDGVLFIDEAYSLIAKGEDFGQEAVATLLKRMEDDRDRLIVILAGYTNEMEEFINSNPGLRSRFNRYIEFPDYSAEELSEIFFAHASQHDYMLSEEVKQNVRELFTNIVANKPHDFGNARYVRNLFERVVQAQANRLASIPDVTRNMLTEIKLEDIESARKMIVV